MSNDFDVPADPSGVHPQSGVQPVGVAPPKRKGRPPGTKNKPRKNLPGPKDPAEVERKGKRTPCEDLTNKYPLQEVVFYEEYKRHKGVGVFHDPEQVADPKVEAENPDGAMIAHDKNRGKMVAIMSFLQMKDGRRIWAYRPVPKVGGGTLMHHDMLLVSPSNLIPLANAMIRVATEWFGGQRAADEKRIEYQQEKKMDLLGEKIRKEGIF